MADNDKTPPPGFLYYRETCELIRKTAPWVATIVMGWWGVLMVRALAGQLTYADIEILVRVFGDKAAKPAPAWGVAVAAIIYGWLQRREKLRKTRYLQGRIKQLETGKDPSRSSSGLLEDGSTNPEDE